MFSESTYLNGRNKEQPMFIMNQDGFTLLAMGFNGKKAMEFKLKYIEALKSLVKAEEEKQQLALENKKQQEQIPLNRAGEHSQR